jgi:hypothetical protein
MISKKPKSITDRIDYFLELLPQLTQDESDNILAIINWDNEDKAAFKFAKIMFEETNVIKA